MRTHTYSTDLAWSGSTGRGYRAYSRTHRASAPPNGPEVTLSADAAFAGSADLLNPEVLLLMAASSCQLLSFLAVAASHGVDVLTYTDEATAEMPEDGGPMSVEVIRLAPQIRVAAGTNPDLVLQLVDEAHAQCYIARSLRATTSVAASVTVVA